MKSEKLCVVTTPYWHFSLEYAMNSIASSGFHNIEFWAASPHYCYADYSGEERGARKREILALMEDRELPPPPTAQEKLDIALEHAQMLCQERGERIAIPALRKHMCSYLKGTHGVGAAREAVCHAVSYEALKEIMTRSLIG